MNIIQALSDRPIAFHPVLAKISGSATAGLMLSQLLYWWQRRPENSEWFYKTVNEFENETFLSKDEQLTAVKKLKALGLIEVKVAGIPPVRHFRVVEEKLNQLLESGMPTINCQESRQSIGGNPDNQLAGKPTNIYTEITTENKKEIYKEKRGRVRATATLFSLDQVPDDYVQEVADKFSVDFNVAKYSLEKMGDYYLAKGEKRPDWKASFRNWVRKGIEFGEIPQMDAEIVEFINSFKNLNNKTND